MTDINVASLKKININEKGIYMIHAAIQTDYEKYPSTQTLSNMDVLAEVNKFHNVHLLKMTPYKKFKDWNLFMN